MNKWLAGLLYGMLVWMVMTTVVQPLSKAPASAFQLSRVVSGTLIIMVMVELPISLIT